MEKKFQLCKIRGKEGQIGATLTWFVAFLIIFFVIILFISSTIILSFKKKINIELIEYNSESLESQRVLINIIKNPVFSGGSEIQIKELFEKWAVAGADEKEKIKNEIKKEVQDVIDGSKKPNQCYVFHAVLYSTEQMKKNIDEASKIDSRAGMYSSETIEKGTIEIDNLLKLTDPRVSWGPEKQRADMLNNAPEIKIILEDDYIKIQFFSGGVLKCQS